MYFDLDLDSNLIFAFFLIFNEQRKMTEPEIKSLREWTKTVYWPLYSERSALQKSLSDLTTKAAETSATKDREIKLLTDKLNSTLKSMEDLKAKFTKEQQTTNKKRSEMATDAAMQAERFTNMSAQLAIATKAKETIQNQMMALYSKNETLKTEMQNIRTQLEWFQLHYVHTTNQHQQQQFVA